MKPASQPTDTPRPKKLSRGKKLLIWLASAFVVYTVVGFFVAPAVIKSQMLKRLPPMLGRPVAVADVKVNPYTLSLAIRGFAVNEKDGSPFAGFDEFFATLKYSSFVSRGWSAGEVYLTHPYASLTHSKEGKLNFDDIIATLAANATTNSAPSAKSPIPLFAIDSLHIDNANITMEDYYPPKPVKTKLIPIHVRLDNVTTEPGAHNTCSFTATSDTGETFDWKANFVLDPPAITGDVTVKNLDLKKYSPYLDSFAYASVADGRVDVAAHYTASLGTNGPDVTLGKTDMQVRSLNLKSASPDESVLSVSNVMIALTDASLAQRRIHVASVKTFDGHVLARQNPDGTINLLALVKPMTNTVATPATNGPAQPPWALTVDDISADRYDIAVEDLKPTRPAKLSIAGLSFHATNFCTVSNPPLGLNIALNLNDAGRVNVNGTVHLQPPSADLSLDVTGMDLRPLQPYVEQNVKLSLGNGLFTLHGHATYDAKASPQATFEGDVGLTNFATSDLIQFKDFVKFDSLSVSGIKAAYLPTQLAVGEVKLSGLSTSVIMMTNQQINLLAVLPPKPPGATNAPAPAGPPLNFPVTLASLVIDKASLHFTDTSIEPNCIFDVQQFDGTIKGLSSDPDARATVDLHGKVDDVSTFSVTGDVNPLSKDIAVNLGIDCKNVNLTPFTPYVEKFGGYQLQRGKLLTDLHYNISHDVLAASNHVTVNGFTLGAASGNTNATKLPVKLGIALLKDRQGNIILDVPLSGRLSDPNFRVWPIVWQVVGNIFAKAATAPFTLLGSLFGGGEEMSYVDFQPGMSDIQTAEQAKLDKLAKSLFERPAIQVEISAMSDPQSDVPALTRVKLDDQIRSLQARELIAAGTPPDSVEAIKVDPTNYSRLLKELYQQIIATNAASTNVSSASTAVSSTNTTETNAITWNQSSIQHTTQLPPTFNPYLPRLSGPSPQWLPKGGELLVLDSSPGNLASDFMAAGAPSTRAVAQPTTTKSIEAAKISASVTTNATQPEVTSQAPATPTTSEVSPDQMQAALLANIQVTTDDLRALMQARARSVQSALVAGGKVEGGRLFILAPAPVSVTSQGQARANLSLQ